MTSEEAYWYTFHNYRKPGFDLNHYQEEACTDPRNAYYFALNIPGADLQYCRKACERSKSWLDAFNKMIIDKAML